MKLYQMELYKICSKKMFLFSILACFSIIAIYFLNFVLNAESTINGVKYTGYQAVKMDREITEEFKGELTDQKVTQIIEKYGFPDGISEEVNRFQNQNYLNYFVMKEFSDGYFYAWDNCRVATCTYPITETKFGKASTATGKAILLEYSYGWQVFTKVLEVGCILGIAFILLALSPVFAEEKYINTQQILFTTKEGRAKDIAAKIAAGMTIVAGVYAMIVLLDFVLMWRVFGLDGFHCFYGQVMDEWVSDWNNYNNGTTDFMRDFICYFVFACFLGTVEAGALSLYFSAHCKSPFHSIIVTAASILAPLFLNLLGREGGYNNYNNVLYITSQVFIMLLLGIAFMCFVPDISNKAYFFLAKMSCCALFIIVWWLFRNKFLFHVALPVWLIMRDMYYNIGIFRSHFPWMVPGIFILAAGATVSFLVCSWKKYNT